MSERSVLIVNETDDVRVTFYIYPLWHRRRFLSISKIIEPRNSYLHREIKDFRYELTVHNDENRRTTIVDIRHWERDLFYKITAFGTAEERNLSDCPELRQIIRRQNRERELSSEGFYNLYEILELDIEEVRKMKEPEQTEVIKKAYMRQIRRWHPDRNPESGDPIMCPDILRAYEILRDRESRATYHNVADYDKGWLSKARFRSIFCPECVSEKQKKEYRKRMAMMTLSGLMACAGFALTIFTAGASIPAVIGGGILIGTGLNTLRHTINRKAIEEEVDTKKFLKSVLLLE